MDEVAGLSVLSILRLPPARGFSVEAPMSSVGLFVRAILLVPLAILGAVALVVATVVATGLLILRPFRRRARAR